MYYNKQSNLYPILRRLPNAVAVMQGSAAYSQIEGTVKFYQAPDGVLVVADILGLPYFMQFCKNPIFALHIHSGTLCSGNSEDPFADAGMHYNSRNCPHPYHAGDMPPLFSANGRGFLAFLTDRFTIDEILGKTVILHDHPDDFTTQPSGNSGDKIACGVIAGVRR